MELYFEILPRDVWVQKTLLLKSFPFLFHESTCMLGESGSGKTLFLKELKKNKNYRTNGTVDFYFGKLTSIKNWKSKIHYEMLDTEDQFFCDVFFQNGKQIGQKCGLVLKLLKNPNYFFCDDLHLCYHDLELLVSYSQKKSIFLFYVSNNIEVTTYFSYLIVLKNHQVAVEGKTHLVLKEEKLMKVLGYSLPFYVNLSIQLGYYGLMNSICFNKEDMEICLRTSKNL